MKEKNLKQKTLKLIRENPKIRMMTDVYRNLGISATTFYKKFPKESQDFQDIKDALEVNRIDTKASILDLMIDSGKPACLIAAYRLLATPEERKALNMKDEQEQTQQQTFKLTIE